MRGNTTYRWHEGRLHAAAAPEGDDGIRVADSWLVTDGRVRALELHRIRFLDALGAVAPGQVTEAEHFWDAAIAELPRTGEWFPRVELHDDALLLRVRPAPELSRSLAIASHGGPDPRPMPHVKGPAIAEFARLRSEASPVADDIVVLDADGHIVEAGTAALLWWRGDVLCLPEAELPRVDSVTARSVVALATALGHDISWERVEPAALDGLETWAVNALHGIRIVTSWHGGPQLAEEPGRLAAWRARLDALRRPLPMIQVAGAAR